MGSYGLAPILERADVIVWLDLPRRVAVRRIVMRHLRLSLQGGNPHKGLRLLARFVRSQRRYYTAPAREPAGPMDWEAITRAGTELALRPHQAKVVQLRAPRAVKRWFQHIN